VNARLKSAIGTVMVLAVVLAPLIGGEPAGAVTPSQINGSGSSWAENAVDEWVQNINDEGIKVVYTPDGDAQGRQDFASGTSDFAVTADGYQGFDSTTGQSDSSSRSYAYLPIAAGGTSFPYQIKFDGQQVENLRLSGETLAKIFTNQITNWDNPEITADNNGVQLPSLPITPVVQSEGSGSTEQLTNYFATQYPSIWKPYAGQAGPTEYFPRQGNQIAQDGSNGAMNYVTSSEANGSIGYVEYSFALSVNYPVAKLLNSAGYYTLPTQYNVAVSLEAAQINTDQNPADCASLGYSTSPCYLLQKLNGVYTDPDPRTYPLSSYVYMIEPTSGTDSKMTDGKWQALADFAYYSICQGQKQIGPIGYSPLPVNLVEAGFGQINQLQTADPSISLANENIDTCNNPTFVLGQPNTNYLATIAPLPPACDKQGAGPCVAGVTPNGIGITATVSGTYPGTASSSQAGTTTTTAPTASGGASTSATTAAAGAASAGTAASSGASSASGASGSGVSDAAVKPPPYASAALAEYDSSSPWGPIVAVLLLLALATPFLVGYLRSRRRREGRQ
jgi:phosphate transport system substrate-binding protein